MRIFYYPHGDQTRQSDQPCWLRDGGKSLSRFALVERGTHRCRAPVWFPFRVSGDMGRSKSNRNTRKRLFKEQKGLCFYCQEPMLLRYGSLRPTSATLDHIIPLSKGGVIGATLNTVAACKKCNEERGNTDARLFLFKKQGII